MWMLRVMRTRSERAPPQTAIVAYGVGGALALVGLWSVCQSLWNPPEYLLPSPFSVLTTGYANLPDLLNSSFVTLLEVVAGFLLATFIGFALALMLHLSAGFARLVWPIVLLIQLTPQVAFAPLLILWFGIGLISKIAMAASIAFFPVVINTFIGLRSVDESTRELAYAMRVGRIGSLIYFEIPTALPQILGGIRIAITYAVVGAVVAEFISSNAGLGHLILVANGALDTSLAIAAIIVLSLMGSLLFLLVFLFERRIAFWHVSQRRQSASRLDVFGT
jgi:NitT/TauT family transport system permease protein